MGVFENIIDASFQALMDSIIYKLMKNRSMAGPERRGLRRNAGRDRSVPAGVFQPPVDGRADQRRILRNEIERDAAILAPRTGIGPGFE